MSKGPGVVQRAIREMIEREQAEQANLRIPSAAVYAAAFGRPPWKRAQEVSAQRAMHRIMAGEEGWRTEGGKRRRTVFCFDRPNGALAETPRRASAPVQPDVGAAEPPTPAFPRGVDPSPAARPYAPGTVNLPTAGAAPKSATTVCVACKLPSGLVLRIQEVYQRRVAAPGGFITEQAARDVGPIFSFSRDGSEHFRSATRRSQ
jgi:hypothetical protein